MLISKEIETKFNEWAKRRGYSDLELTPAWAQIKDAFESGFDFGFESGFDFGYEDGKATVQTD